MVNFRRMTRIRQYP